MTTPLFWCKWHTTGGDPSDTYAYPLELAVVLTNHRYEVQAHRSWVCEAPPDFDWSQVDAKVLAMHGRSGLIGEALADEALNTTQLAAKVTAFLGKHYPGGPFAPLGPLCAWNPPWELRWLRAVLPDIARRLDLNSVLNVGTLALMSEHRGYPAAFDWPEPRRAPTDLRCVRLKLGEYSANLRRDRR